MSFKDFLDPATPLEDYKPECPNTELEELLTLLMGNGAWTHQRRLRALCLIRTCTVHTGDVTLRKAIEQILHAERKAIEAELTRRKIGE
jgi:hypothetical protein